MYAYYAVRSNNAVHSIRVYPCESKCVCVGWKLLVEAEMWTNASYVEDTFCTLPIELTVCTQNIGYYSPWV